MQEFQAPGSGRKFKARFVREFRDVVFKDVEFDNNSLLTLKTEGAGTSHLKLILVRGF